MLFLYMESILIHPENIEQLEVTMAVLKVLKVPFEPQSETLPQHIVNSIDKSIMQYENGQAISLSEFKQRHFLKNEF